MKHTPYKKSIVETCFFALLYTSFFLPFVFSLHTWNPFESPKFFFFLLITELIFPFYVVLLSQHQKLRSSYKNSFFLTLIGFLILETVAALLGKDPMNSFFGNTTRVDGLILWWHLPLTYLYLDCAFRLRSTAKKTILHLYLGIMGGVALIGCLQAIHLVPVYSQQFGERVASTMSNPIFFAATLVIPFFLALDRFRLADKTKWKYLYASVSLLCLMGIIASQTRGAFVGLILGSLIYVLLLFFQSKHPKKYFFAAACLFLCVLSATSLFIAREQASSTSSFYRLTHFQDQSANSRLLYWTYSLQGFKEAPWFGVGHQNFYVVANKYYTLNTFPDQMNWPDKPHNTFLEILVTGGIFVFFAYLFLFVFSIKSAWKTPDAKPLLTSSILIAALVAYSVQNVFSFDVVETLFAFILLLAFMNIHPTDHAVKSTLLPTHNSYWITGIIPVIGFCFFLFPVIKEMHLAYITEINAKTNLIPALEALEKSSQIQSATNSILLASQYKDVLNSAITLHHAPIETIERIQKNAVVAFSRAINLHPSQALLMTDSVSSSYLYAIATNNLVPQENIQIAKRAHELAPGRIEPLILLANVYRVNKEQEKANAYAAEALQMNPEHGVYLWKLALFYARANNFDKAAPLGIQALQANVPAFQSANELDWLIQYFQSKTDKKSKENLIFLYELAEKIEPSNSTLLLKLLNLYAQNNQQEKMMETVNLFKQKNPSSAASIDTYVKSLRK